MFSEKVVERNLDKLIKLSNVDLQVQVQNQLKGDKDVTLYQVMAKGTVFNPEIVGDRGPQITKSVQIIAVGTSVEDAQDKALEKLQKLLGV